LLNKTLKEAKVSAIGAIVWTISTAVGAMVKFLSHLPNVASDIRKIATKGAQYNITEDLLKQYRALGKAMGMDNNGELFSEAQGSIHAKLGDIIHGDLNASISAMAAVSAIANGKSIDSMVDYYRGIVKDPDKVMREVTNDVMKASFLGKAVGKDRLDPNEAFSSNVRAAEIDFGMGRLLSYMFEYWQKITNGKEKDEIRRKVVEEDADFITLMWDYMGQPLSDRDVSGGVEAERAEEVAKSFGKLKALYESVRDGILLKILALMEPISDWLRMLLIHTLEFLNKFPLSPLKDQLTGTIIHLYDENVARNAKDSLTVANQMKLTGFQVETLRNNYDMNNVEKRNVALSQIEKGFTPAGMSWDDSVVWAAIEHLYAQQQKDLGLLTSEEGVQGKVLVSDISPTAQGDTVTSYLNRANGQRVRNMEDVVKKYNIENLTVEEIEELQGRLKDETFDVGARLVDKDHMIRLLDSDGPWYDVFPGIFRRLLPIGKAAISSTMEEKDYRRLEEIEQEMLALEELKAMLPKGGIDDSVLYFRDVQRGMVNNAVKTGENVVSLAQIHDIIGREMGDTYLRGIQNNTMAMQISFNPEKREYTIYVKDVHTGKPLGFAKDIYALGIRNTITADSLFNWQARFEAPSPVQLGDN